MRTLADFKGMALDEAHNIKNPNALRTKAAGKIAASLPDGALRLFLTGTPILNRPEELIEPLRMLGTLSDLPGSRMTTRWFRNRYCRDQAREAELADLVRTVALRRTKDQVLTDLPAKTRADQWIEMDADTRELYLKLAREGLERAQQTNAEAIVYINELRKAVGKIKTRIALDWAKNFLAGSSKQLVIFAYYQDTQHGIIDGLRAAGYDVTHILGGQSTDVTEAQKARFQAGTSRVIVCSLLAAGQGHTLTAASDVLMVEQEWRPGIHWQAEDRCHRIGQADAVTAWYLLCTDTVDVGLFNLIDGKARMVKAVMDGDTDGEQEISTVAYLLGMVEGQLALAA